jgi:hypothetical protein
MALEFGVRELVFVAHSCPRDSELVAASVRRCDANQIDGASQSRSLSFRAMRHSQQKLIIWRHELKQAFLFFLRG